MAENKPKHTVSWAAGFFEGEGHVKFVKRKKDGGRWFAIEIAQVHREPLDQFVELFGVGKVYGPYGPYTTQKQPYYVYVAYGAEGKEVVTQMRPWLFRKGQQTDVALAQYEEHLFDKS